MSEEINPVALEINQIKEQLSQLSKEELIDKLAMYEFVLPKLGPFVQWAMDHMYDIVLAKWRMGRQVIGYLVGVELVPERLVILADEEIRDYTKKKIIHEQHIVYAPLKELTYYDIVLGKTGEEELEI